MATRNPGKNSPVEGGKGSWNPSIYRVKNHHPNGGCLGLLPSTVSCVKQVCVIQGMNKLGPQPISPGCLIDWCLRVTTFEQCRSTLGLSKNCFTTSTEARGPGPKIAAQSSLPPSGLKMVSASKSNTHKYAGTSIKFWGCQGKTDDFSFMPSDFPGPGAASSLVFHGFLQGKMGLASIKGIFGGHVDILFFSNSRKNPDCWAYHLSLSSWNLNFQWALNCVYLEIQKKLFWNCCYPWCALENIIIILSSVTHSLFEKRISSSSSSSSSSSVGTFKKVVVSTHLKNISQKWVIFHVRV